MSGIHKDIDEQVWVEAAQMFVPLRTLAKKVGTANFHKHHERTAQKQFCAHGHPLSGENLRISQGNRRCRACEARRTKTYRAKKKAERS